LVFTTAAFAAVSSTAPQAAQILIGRKNPQNRVIHRPIREAGLTDEANQVLGDQASRGARRINGGESLAIQG
jgi:hypothetical protein